MSRSRKKNPVIKYGQYVTKSQANKRVRRANKVLIKKELRAAYLPDSEDPYDIWDEGSWQLWIWFDKEFKLPREIVNQWDICDVKSTMFNGERTWWLEIEPDSEEFDKHYRK